MNKCCGLRLNTAAVVVGSLFLIASLYASGHTTYNLVHSMGRPQNEYRFRSFRYIDTDSIYFHVFCVCFSVASLISSIFLIVGAVKNKSKYLIPWLLVGMLMLIGLIGFLVVLIYMYAVYFLNNGHLDLQLILQFIAPVIAIALQSYLWRVIQQLYKNIKDIKERKKILPTTEPLYPQPQMLC